MKKIVAFSGDGQQGGVPFFLAVEEWVAMHLPSDHYLMAWHDRRAVICGRHQHIPSEVDMDYARLHGINVYRRRSGGGSVYADGQNVMFSYISPGRDVIAAFSRYTHLMTDMLRNLGVNADISGRNDICVNGCKIAGNAYYGVGSSSIVHGTMLYDADFDTMSHVLTPSRAKIMSKGVVSVPSRVTTLKAEGLTLSRDEFVEKAMKILCNDDTYVLNDSAIAQVGQLMKRYEDTSGLANERLQKKKTYIDGVGQIAVELDKNADGTIRKVNLQGDFFSLVDDAEAYLSEALRGKRPTASDIRQAIEHRPADGLIQGLTDEKLIELLSN